MGHAAGNPSDSGVHVMLEVKHKRARFQVREENAPALWEALSVIDKSKGMRPKAKLPTGEAKQHSGKRDYPRFNPQCMLTSDYVTAYVALNHKRLRLAPLETRSEINRTPAGLDPSYPEVIEESTE